MPTYPTYKLGDIAEIINGKNQKEVVSSQGEYPIFGSGGIIGWATDYLCKENSTIIGRKGTINSPIFVSRKFWNVDTAFGIQPSDKVLPRYLFFFCKSFDFKKLDKSTTIPSLAKRDLLQIPIPLPPLPTQHAIVTRIETLFAELDKAVQHLRTAQQQLKTYRQAVLRNAFEGNLTKEWRNHNHISDETWEEKEFSSIAEIKSNLVDVADYKDYPHIAPDNIEKETGKLFEYHTIAEDGVISGKHRFFAGQILYSKIRPNLSKVVIVDFDGLCSADMYPIEAKGNTKFLWYQMLSDRFVDYASNSGSRTVLPKINQKGLSIIPMKICSIEEQNEVVIQIESRLSQAEAAEASIAEALQKTEALRQSILKKAFSGELV